MRHIYIMISLLYLQWELLHPTIASSQNAVIQAHDAEGTNQRRAREGDICKGLREAFWTYFQTLKEVSPDIAELTDQIARENLKLDINSKQDVDHFACMVSEVQSIKELTVLLHSTIPSGDANYKTLYERWVTGYRTRDGVEGLTKGIQIKDSLTQYLLASGVSDIYLPWEYTRSQLDPMALTEFMMRLRREFGPAFLTYICAEPQHPIILMEYIDIVHFVMAASESSTESEFAVMTGIDPEEVAQLNMAVSTLMTRNQKMEELEIVMLGALDRAGLLDLQE